MDWGKVIEFKRANRVHPIAPSVPILPEHVLVFVPVCVVVKVS